MTFEPIPVMFFNRKLKIIGLIRMIKKKMILKN